MLVHVYSNELQLDYVYLPFACKCNPQQIFNFSATYITHHLTTSNKANILRVCLDITFDISRRLANTKSKTLLFNACINTEIYNISETAAQDSV